MLENQSGNGARSVDLLRHGKRQYYFLIEGNYNPEFIVSGENSALPTGTAWGSRAGAWMLYGEREGITSWEQSLTV